VHLPAFAAGQTRAAGVHDDLEQCQNVVGRSGRDRSGQPTEAGNVIAHGLDHLGAGGPGPGDRLVGAVVGRDQAHTGCRFLPQQGTDRLLDAVFLVVCRDDRHYLRRIMRQVVG